MSQDQSSRPVRLQSGFLRYDSQRLLPARLSGMLLKAFVNLLSGPPGTMTAIASQGFYHGAHISTRFDLCLFIPPPEALMEIAHRLLRHGDYFRRGRSAVAGGLFLHKRAAVHGSSIVSGGVPRKSWAVSWISGVAGSKTHHALTHRPLRKQSQTARACHAPPPC